MSDLEPRGMNDMTGWHKLTCDQSDFVRDRHAGISEWHVASSLTDPDGSYGTPTIFTEWWLGDVPVLREYNRMVPRECRHYGAMDASAAVERDRDE